MDSVAAVADAASQLAITPRSTRWAHLSLCVLDAVFSVGGDHPDVVRTCESYAAHARVPAHQTSDEPPVIGTDAEQSLAEFVASVEDHGEEEFAAEVLQNEQRTGSRSGLLTASVAAEFGRVLVTHGVERFADLPRLWSDVDRLGAVEDRLRAVPGNGTADVRLGYFWMLTGADDVIKPDRVVLGWLETVIGGRPSVTEARQLVTAAALVQGCTAWELDHAIWVTGLAGSAAGHPELTGWAER